MADRPLSFTVAYYITDKINMQGEKMLDKQLPLGYNVRVMYNCASDV